jgi:tetratricopeptide (TPR) repeat protein
VILRFSLSAILILLSLLGCYYSAREGLAGHIARYAPETRFLEYANKLASDNPKIYLMLGEAYLLDPDKIDISAANVALDRAAQLAPNRFQIFLARAKAQERAGNMDGALQSLARAAELAPNYFEPRWQYANLLARTDRFEQCLPEFRAALSINGNQLGYALDLVWQLSDGDLKSIDAIMPNSRAAQLEYLQLLIRKGRLAEAAQRWQKVKTRPMDQQFLAFSQQFLENLLIAKNYRLAFEVWRGLPAGAKAVEGQIANGDFNDAIEQQQIGFQWQVSDHQKQCKLLLDHRAPTQDGKSLRIDYESDGKQDFDHIHQLILVAPNSEYRLRYYARSQELTSGALPYVEINNGEPVLTRSAPNLLGSVDWQPYEVTFKVGAQTDAITIAIKRSGQCPVAEAPCPIFGHVWFTNFALERIR